LELQLIHNLLENSAARNPDQIALVCGGERIAYGCLNTQADALAGSLRATGIGPGHRIALLLENGIDYVTAYYAVLKAGAAVAPLSTALKPGGLHDLIDHLEPTAIVTNSRFEYLLKAAELETPSLRQAIIRSPKQSWSSAPFSVSKLEELLSPSHSSTSSHGIASSPDNLASILYTSGSTGRPKGVMLSHRNIVANTHAICQYLELTENDIQMAVLPFFYVMGKSLLNTHIAAGGTIVINNRFRYPADVIHQMIEEKVTGFSGVPSTYAYLLHRSPLAICRDKLPYLRYCSQAGGHMAASIKKELLRTLPPHTRLFIMYGATEASARLTYLDPDHLESRIESIGKPIPGVAIRIMDEQGREVDDGQEGELVAGGPNIMQGYWKEPQDTAQVLDQHGYHTGDIGFRDAQGFLYVTRRKDGILKVGGHRINPVEIEDYLLATELVIECAVIGLPDPLLGNKLVAVVVPKEDTLTPEALLHRCAETLPANKVPAQIKFLRLIPKNGSGKIDKTMLVDLLG
jgi:long-chain acyl-CoA synthetase